MVLQVFQSGLLKNFILLFYAFTELIWKTNDEIFLLPEMNFSSITYFKIQFSNTALTKIIIRSVRKVLTVLTLSYDLIIYGLGFLNLDSPFEMTKILNYENDAKMMSSTNDH